VGFDTIVVEGACGYREAQGDQHEDPIPQEDLPAMRQKPFGWRQVRVPHRHGVTFPQNAVVMVTLT
jgi:hypothetical protein